MGHRNLLVTHTLPDRSAAPHAERPPRQRLRSTGEGFSYASLDVFATLPMCASRLSAIVRRLARTGSKYRLTASVSFAALAQKDDVRVDDATGENRVSRPAEDFPPAGVKRGPPREAPRDHARHPGFERRVVRGGCWQSLQGRDRTPRGTDSRFSVAIAAERGGRQGSSLPPRLINTAANREAALSTVGADKTDDLVSFASREFWGQVKCLSPVCGVKISWPSPDSKVRTARDTRLALIAKIAGRSV